MARRIALLGCGLWGRKIFQELKGLGCIVAVLDPAIEARAAAIEGGAEFAAKHFAELPDVDAYLVATPATVHLRSLRDVAATGRPALCEKPLAASPDDVEAIARLDLPNAYMLDVWRYHPAIEMLGALARSGELGELRGLGSVRANWTSPRVDVDTLWNLGAHEISVYREIVGALPTPVAALVERHSGRIVHLSAHWRGPASMSSILGNRSPRRQRVLSVHGSDAVGVFDLARGHGVEIGRGAADVQLEAADKRWLPVSEEPALRRQLRVWIEYLDGGPPPKTTLADGIDSVRRLVALELLARD